MTTTSGTTPLEGTALSSTAPAAEHGRSLSGKLGVGAIVFMVVAAAAPLTVIGGATPIGILLGNGAGFPSMYVVAGVVLLLFSVGLAAMARSIPRPGAFFTYVGYGLGRPLGLGTAWLALLTYTAVQLAVYCYIGFSINLYLTTLLHAPSVPWWIYSLVIVAIVGVLGYHNIELSSKVLGVALVAEIGITLLLSVVVVAQGGAEGLSLTTFAPAQITSGAPGIGLMLAFAGFIGFEATAIFRDEAKDPQKTIPRATYLAVVVIGVFYTFASWALVMAWGPDNVVDQAAADPGGMILLTAQKYLGTVGGVAIQTLLLTSLFACVLSFHNVLTRYQHVMGTVSVLPKRLGSVHRDHGSPHFSSVVQTVTAVLLIAVTALLRLDPVIQAFTWYSGLATIAIIVMMALTSVAVTVYFRRFPNEERSTWKRLWAPLLATLGLLGVAGVVIAYFPVLMGSGWTFAICFLLAVPVFVVAGYAQALVIRRKDPAVYSGIIETLAQ